MLITGSFLFSPSYNFQTEKSVYDSDVVEMDLIIFHSYENQVDETPI